MSDIDNGNEVGTEVPEQELENVFYDHVAVAKRAEEKSKVAKEAEVKKEEPSEPWKAKKTNDTPAWAKQRFKEYSGTVRELKEANAQLMGQVKQILSAYKPEEKKLSIEDFPDVESYHEHMAELKTNEKVGQAMTELEKRRQSENEVTQLRNADAYNVQQAKTDLPDYEEAIENADPDIRLPIEVVKHLHVSPAGPYVRYILATDEEFANAVKGATPQQRLALISQKHDEILDTLASRVQNKGPKEDVPQKNEANVSPTARRQAPPAAPPKVKGSASIRNISSLSGDDYIKARNEQRRGR